MHYTNLGKTRAKVSKVGIGVWQASDEWHGDNASIIKAIGKASDLGVNFIDTAEVYGNGSSERVVGQALRRFGREKFVVATKVYGAHLRHDELLRACEGSLQRMGLKEIDLYQVHWPDPWEQIPLRHTMTALQELQRDGTIGAIGVSNFAVRDLKEAGSLLDGIRVVSNQVRYNLLQREIEEEVLPYCTKEDISVIAWSPLAQGVLGGRYTSRNQPKNDVRRGNPLFASKNILSARRVISALTAIGSERGFTPAQVALAWLATKRGVISIPGAKTPAQAEENATSSDLRLKTDDLRRIESAADSTQIDYYLPTPPAA